MAKSVTEMTPADARSVDELIRLHRAGRGAQYLCFWGHKPKHSGRVDRSCLSNWFPAPFELEGVHYATTEHYMMAGKARLFGDADMLAEILAAASPMAAKKLGRKVRNFEDGVWKRHCFDIVVAGNFAKFGQNEALGRYLLATGDAVLVEASPRDRIWGIGMGASNPKARDPERWRGRNLLGFALMEVRARLS